MRGYTIDTENTEALPRAFLLFYQRYAEKVYFVESDDEGAFRLKLPIAALQSGLISYAAEKHGYVSSRTDSSIKVEWPKVANASGYEISWGSTASATGGNGSPRTITPGSSNTESVTINGLAANRNYYIKARAIGSGNYATSDWSGAKGQKTLPVPRNLRVVRTTDASIKVSWNAVANSSGYRLTLDGTPRPRDIPGRSQSHTITGLQRNKSYTIKVMALGGGD